MQNDVVPSFREIGQVLNSYSEEKFDYKKECDRVTGLAAQLGLEKEFTSDVRMSFCFLRGT